MRWDLADLVAVGDIADECGVGSPAVSNWTVRYPDFPQPLAAVSRGRVSLYSRKAVLDWYDRKSWQNDGPRGGRCVH